MKLRLTEVHGYGARSPRKIAPQKFYVIVVHGTTFGRKAGSWCKRLADKSTETTRSDTDYPFCEYLDSKLKAYDLPISVWGNCDDLEMEEFKWSGLNEHNARVLAGKQLAAYINDCKDRFRQRFGSFPAFILIGHSHGGNVILSSISDLHNDVILAGLHFMGTPFFRYRASNLKWKHNMSHDKISASGENYFNLYASGHIESPINLYNEDSGEGIDEVIGMFALLRQARFFKDVSRNIFNAIFEFPKKRHIESISVIHSVFGRTNSTNTLDDLAIVHYRSSFPTPVQKLLANISYISQWVLLPVKYVVLSAGVEILSKKLSRDFFRFVTGLDPLFFNPSNVYISSSPGFNAISRRAHCVPPSMLPNSKIGLNLGDVVNLKFAPLTLLRNLLQNDNNNRDDMPELTSINIEVASDFLAKIELICKNIILNSEMLQITHTAYYKSDLLIDIIADEIALDINWLSELWNWPHFKKGHPCRDEEKI